MWNGWNEKIYKCDWSKYMRWSYSIWTRGNSRFLRELSDSSINIWAKFIILFLNLAPVIDFLINRSILIIRKHSKSYFFEKFVLIFESEPFIREFNGNCRFEFFSIKVKCKYIWFMKPLKKKKKLHSRLAITTH